MADVHEVGSIANSKTMTRGGFPNQRDSGYRERIRFAR
jgi:hypothetical protein